MNTKICTKCGEEKAATTEFFFKQKRGKYGVRGECKSCRKMYLEQNKQRKRQYDKQYHENNKEKIKEYKKQYREINKEKVSEWGKQHFQKNKHLYRQYKAKRRSSKLNQTPHYANLDLIKLIYENCPKGYHVDHMMPLVSGGLHHESNLCYLPASINLAKGVKTIEEFGLDTFNKNVVYWQDHLTRYV